MRTIHRDIVAALLFSKDGKLLQGLKDLDGGGVYPGCWGIIGGGVEEGEDHKSALIREMLEETGIDISTYPFKFIAESEGESEKTLKTGEKVICKMRFHQYEVVISDRNAREIQVTLDDEHSEYRWSGLGELKDMNLTPPSVELFRKLGYL